MMHTLAHLSLALLLFVAPVLTREQPLADGERRGGWAGQREGTWHWRLPDTQNGLHPTQSWHATGSAPNGDIYVAGMDHVSNAALYRLSAEDGGLELVGDARSASEAAHNWMPGETAQKFHTRPLWHRGRVFVATMDRSSFDEAYRARRGFHWYAYDPDAKTFSDLSAAQPGGTAIAHGNAVTLGSDPERNIIYAAGVPTGEIYRYDVARGTTENLGRPPWYTEAYVYTGRVMWVDRGRLYFSLSRADGQPSRANIQYYDPETGFGEERDWLLQDGRALEVGQCLHQLDQCVFSDDKGHVYRLDKAAHTWSYLGRVESDLSSWGYIWSLAVSADGRTAYVTTSTSPQPSETTALYAFELFTGKTRAVSRIADLDPSLNHLHVHTGYDAWDRRGRFYFASFSVAPERSVIVTRIDPARLDASARP
ncbi:hypothetical protein JNW90_14950 [Micromonospora sp. STR1s_5]|nr:hypothetical protein [Micromonospora sp. STR1s_5]